jgi:hypothetical protein
MNCQFCSQHCTIDKYLWDRCEWCQVSCSRNLRGDILKTHFRVHTNPQDCYFFDINFQENTTEIYWCPLRTDGLSVKDVTLVLSIKSTMQNVTPKNVREKLKTLLVYG